mgnify:CR=1 FL=1
MIELTTEKEIAQYVEECLQDYPANLTRIEVLKKDLEVLRALGDVKAQNYVKIYNNDSRTTPDDPVAQHVQKVMKLEEEIERLKRVTEPLTKMIQDLKSPYALDKSLNSDFIKILGLSYFGRNQTPIILDATGWSRAGFFRKKKQLAELARSYLGL